VIYELPREAYGRVRPLFQRMDEHLAVSAILNGAIATNIWVDDLACPRITLTRSKSRFYLTGVNDNAAFNAALGALFRETIYPQALASGDAMYVLHYAPECWEQTLSEALSDKQPMVGRYQVYSLDLAQHAAPPGDWRTLLPDGIVLRQVDRELLAEEGLAHLDDLREEMCSERASVDDFLAQSFGVCLVHQDAIIGWCLSEYNTDDRCEIGIATDEAYRRRGLATAMTWAFIEQALAWGIRRIGWDCWANNVASSATARKAGFAKVADHSVLFAYYDEAENLAVHGDIALGEGQYAEALHWLEQSLATGRAKGWAYWRAGCAAARLSQPEMALDYLNQAVDRGFAWLAGIRDSEHLASLHGAPEWDALLTRLER